MREAVSDLAGCPLSHWSWLKASLPSSLGGLNIRQATLHVRRYDTIALGLLKKEEEEEERRMQNSFFLLRVVRIKIALYSNVIHSFDLKSAIEHDRGV